MNKETIRPILVAEAEKWRAAEASYQPPADPTWAGLAALLEARQAARLKRAQAELQLWLADKQWEREELEGRAAVTDCVFALPTSKT